MKKIYYSLVVVILSVMTAQAQVTVEFDANAEFIGFANVFETPANGGAYVFGEVWGVPDLKTVIDTGAGTATLQPNFNTWDPADPFWVTPGGEANKVFEGNTFVENASLIGEVVTFEGFCESNTLDPAYAVKAFIKVFNADFSVVKEVNAVLTPGENFSITYDDVEGTDTTFQYGFAVTGLVADPADEAALGSAVVSAPDLSINGANALSVATYPNPTTGMVTLKSSGQMTSVAIVNTLGQTVKVIELEGTQTSIDISELANGMYFLQVAGENGQGVVQVIKK